MFKTWGLFPGNSRKLRDEFCTAVKAHQSQVTTASGAGNWTLDFVAGDMRMKVIVTLIPSGNRYAFRCATTSKAERFL